MTGAPSLDGTAQSILIPKEPDYCPVCNFKTKINGRLQHDFKCNMRSEPVSDRPEVTDAMRHAAWSIYPDADVPYTELYWAMCAAKETR
jgi:hypothetical protein